ncbi:hypothetical protein ACOI1C_10900 [Bacillus sp. DJP31]|uniref:hypothetical protein n=1 Tax=Bacillus sp. DJP31 TaxID=3409789 RepID=UPI003BB557EC
MKKLVYILIFTVIFTFSVHTENYVKANTPDVILPIESKGEIVVPAEVNKVYEYEESMKQLDDGTKLIVVKEYEVNSDGSRTFLDTTDFNDMPSVHEMNNQQKTLFNQLVEEEAKLYGQDNPKLYQELLTDFFDETSETALDFEATQKAIESKLNNKDVIKPPSNEYFSVNPDSSVSTSTNLGYTTQSLGLAIGVNVAASTFNILIGFAVGGGVGAIQAFIVNKGKDAAIRLFSRTVVSRLTAWGAPKLAIFVGAAVVWALDYLNIGSQIARYLDSKDSKPRNGWINF